FSEMFTSRILQTRIPEIFIPISSKLGACNFSNLQRDSNDVFEESNIKNSINSRKKKNTTNKIDRNINVSNNKSTTIRSKKNTPYYVTQYRDYLKGTRSISYIVDENAAKLMFKYIKEDLEPHDIILESHPGPGILTELFLTHTDNKIITYEPKKFFRTKLANKWQESNDKSLIISDLDLHKFYSYYIQAKKAPEFDKLSPLIDPLPIDSGNCNSRVKIATVVTDKKFFYRLNLSYAFQCCFFNTSAPVNPDIYAYIPCRWLDVLSQQKQNSTSNLLSVPFHFYFTYDILDKFPIEGFYPVYNKSSERVRREDDNYLHLIRIKQNPKRKDLIPVAELDNFHYFLNRMLRTKVQDTFIGQIEKFIPNCGPEFIKEGFRVFAHPRNLSQEQLILAYKIFCNLPAYEDCMFHFYKRHWAMQFGEKDEEVLALKCVDEAAIDLEEEEDAEPDIDVTQDFHENSR
ncbi:unnamed protein product, partial [Meganyctiphanes norvegica]